MNILLIIILCMTSVVHCSDDDLLYNSSSDDSTSTSETEEEKKSPKPPFIATDRFRKGMWGTEDWPVEEYRYRCKKKPSFIATDQLIEGVSRPADWPAEKCLYNAEQLTELTESEVLNPFWLKVRDETPEQKDSLLLEIANGLIGDPLYLATRKNIAAAVLIGADLKRIQPILRWNSDLLYKAVSFNDLPLARLLLAHNYHCPTSTFCGNSVIFFARTIAIAKLLVQYGAKTDARSIFNRTLLHQVTDSRCESALISLYRYHGVSPLETDRDGDTPLSLLLEESEDNFIRKAALLLVGLTPDQKIALLRSINIDEEKDSPRIITSLKNFLKKAEEQCRKVTYKYDNEIRNGKEEATFDSDDSGDENLNENFQDDDDFDLRMTSYYNDIEFSLVQMRGQ